MIPGIQVTSIDSTHWRTILEISNSYGRLKSLNITSPTISGGDRHVHYVKINIDEEVIIKEKLKGSITLDLAFENYLKIEAKQKNRPSMEPRIWVSYAIEEEPSMKIDGSDIKIEGLSDNLRTLVKHTQKIQKTQREIEATQDEIGDIPDTLSEALSTTIENTIDKEYDRISALIESDEETQEKKRQLERTLSLGLERGLPTALVEVSEKSDEN